MLTPLPSNKRKRKYTLDANEEAIDDTGSDAEESHDGDAPAKA